MWIRVGPDIRQYWIKSRSAGLIRPYIYPTSAKILPNYPVRHAKAESFGRISGIRQKKRSGPNLYFTCILFLCEMGEEVGGGSQPTAWSRHVGTRNIDG